MALALTLVLSSSWVAGSALPETSWLIKREYNRHRFLQSQEYETWRRELTQAREHLPRLPNYESITKQFKVVGEDRDHYQIHRITEFRTKLLVTTVLSPLESVKKSEAKLPALEHMTAQEREFIYERQKQEAQAYTFNGTWLARDEFVRRGWPMPFLNKMHVVSFKHFDDSTQILVKKLKADGSPGELIANARVTRYAYERLDGKYGAIDIEGLRERFLNPRKFLKTPTRALEEMNHLPVESYLESAALEPDPQVHPVLEVPGSGGRLAIGIKYEIGAWAIKKSEKDPAVRLGGFIETMLHSLYTVLGDQHRIPGLDQRGKIIRTYGDEVSKRFYKHMLFEPLKGQGTVHADGIDWWRLVLKPAQGMSAIASFAKLKANLPFQKVEEIEVTLNSMLEGEAPLPEGTALITVPEVSTEQ